MAQSKSPTQSGNIVFTVNRVYEGNEYMLKMARPNRVWTKNPKHALVFHDTPGARVCIIAFFKSHEHQDVFIGRLTSDKVA